jgi:uncharacterized cupin superfamily protein
MLEGRMMNGFAGAEYQVEPGNALQFDGQAAHGLAQLDELPVRFLSVTAYERLPSDQDPSTPF